ncbi:DUF222 domain-containing protein [Planctomonas psychrotolerans]|uniref:DUF222 domain-containing protein n=1 Tax=Planctomonas psychrotolerans TaxID=2528712 RepID=UPI00123B5B99|nr:DUF222 domain-containing protein [Planctomonas psychrotolerans]
MTPQPHPLVEGEPAELIFEAIRGIDFSGEPVDGLLRIRVFFRGESGAALLRALHRIDEEFLAHDIQAGHGRPRSIRTDGQRRHDAFVELAERTLQALGIAP